MGRGEEYPARSCQDPARANTALVNAEWPIWTSEGRRGAKKAEFCSEVVFIGSALFLHPSINVVD